MAVKLKSPAQIEAMKEAGRVSALALRRVGEAVEPGITTAELDAIAEKVIRAEGGIPAFKGYGGFPGSICASVNDAVVHGIPSRKLVLREGDIISIDTGAIVDGWVGDNAWTYPVGKVAPEVQRLLEVGERCMWEGLDNARPTKRLGDIGHAVQSLAEAAGYSVVRDYVGHGIGREMHEDPNVPNFGRRRTGLKLLPGMVLAIEPMVNAGTRKVKQCSDGWLVRTRDGKPSVHFEKTVAITEDGPVVLTTEEGHRATRVGSMPPCARWRPPRRRANRGWGLVGAALELGVGLAGDEEGMVGQLDHLHQALVGGEARNHETAFHKRVAIGVVHLVAVAVALVDDGLAVGRVPRGCRSPPCRGRRPRRMVPPLSSTSSCSGMRSMTKGVPSGAASANSAEVAPSRPHTSRAKEQTAACSPRQMPRNGTLFSRA